MFLPLREKHEGAYLVWRLSEPNRPCQVNEWREEVARQVHEKYTDATFGSEELLISPDEIPDSLSK